MAENRTSVNGEYELVVYDDDHKAVSIMQLTGPVFFDELPQDNEQPWIEEEVPLEPNKGYSFELRARLRTGEWGPTMKSSALAPRLLPIAVGAPIVDLILASDSSMSMTDIETLEAKLHFEVTVRGFSRGGQGLDTRSPAKRETNSDRADRVAASLSKYQLRSCALNELGENWSEWPETEAVSVYNAPERSLDFDILVQSAPAPLLPGMKYAFGMRCCDVYGRWTDWSAASEPLPFKVPHLVPSLTEHQDGVGSNLKISQMGPRDVCLEWGQFRADWESTV